MYCYPALSLTSCERYPFSYITQRQALLTAQSNNSNMSKLNVCFVFVPYQPIQLNYCSRHICRSPNAKRRVNEFTQHILSLNSLIRFSSACSLQLCLNKNTYAPEKCDSQLRNLYECCDSIKSVSGEGDSGSTACPKPSVVKRWLKNHPR